MIERHWGAIAKANMADHYIQHLRHETFPKLERIAGFKRASILRRDKSDGVQFLIVTVWESEDAIRAFAGDDPEQAVVPGVVREMMLQFDERATHFHHAK